MAKRPSKKAYIQALTDAGGIQAAAAKILGVNRSSVCRAVKRYELQGLLDEIEDETLDLAEGKLKVAIKKGDFRAVRFYLETKGKKRGYTRTVQLEAEKPIPIVFSESQTALG
jgi:hypothetical protein